MMRFSMGLRNREESCQGKVLEEMGYTPYDKSVIKQLFKKRKRSTDIYEKLQVSMEKYAHINSPNKKIL